MSCTICGKTTSSRWYKGPLCTSCHSRAFRLKNPSYHKTYQKNRLSDPEIKSCLSAQNSLNTKRKARQLARRKERYHSDLNYRLRVILRTRLLKAIINKSKVGSAIRDLGCSIDFLKTYLESKFEPGMTWKNQGNGEGKWNIDHIKALANFDLTDQQQFKDACRYTNLQPMWYIDNLRKSDKDE
jgi:hypothetical protein